MNVIRLRTGAWYSDSIKEFPVPPAWKCKLFKQKDARPLSEEQIRVAFDKPIAALPISAEARGSKNAVLIVDDLSRPTPAESICIAAMDLLNRAGIPDNNIRLLIGDGAHRPLSRKEMRLKVGSAMRRAGHVSCHDAYHSPVEYLGQTQFGTPVLVNRLAIADFSLAISGIYPLEVTAFGGGAKMIMPGVSHISSIHWNYTRLTTGARAGNVMGSERRKDIEEYARIFGLTMIANAVINSKREICGLFVGHPIKAYRKGVSFARKSYYSKLDDGKYYDLTIVNAYPLDADPQQMSKSVWCKGVSGPSILMISEFTDPIWYHGLRDGPYSRFSRRKREIEVEQDMESLMGASIILYNRNYAKTFFPQKVEGWYFAADWAKLMRDLEKRFPRAKVRVLPTASIQL